MYLTHSPTPGADPLKCSSTSKTSLTVQLFGNIFISHLGEVACPAPSELGHQTWEIKAFSSHSGLNSHPSEYLLPNTLWK